jgi:hypothetical protein
VKSADNGAHDVPFDFSGSTIARKGAVLFAQAQPF